MNIFQRILARIQDHAQAIAELHGQKPQLIPIKVVCKHCGSPLSGDWVANHKCVARKL